MRIVIGAFSHESSTFTPVATDRAAYESRFGYLRGDELWTTFRATNTPIGGFIEGAEAHDFELIPTIFAEPHPSGPTDRDLFEEILGELLDGISAAGVIDGVLLELHGSMVAEGIADADGHILRAVRDVVGAHVPVVAQLDIHTNMSPEMIECADVLVGRETYPEVDQAERGRECADILVRIIRDGVHLRLLSAHDVGHEPGHGTRTDEGDDRLPARDRSQTRGHLCLRGHLLPIE